jgi:DNA-binding SARP family transcriptional activator
MVAVKVRLFGSLAVDGSEGPVRLGPREERAVLAMLLVQPGRVLPLDRLIGQLWADEPPPGAVATVQRYISRLRRALGPGVLVARGPGYLVDVGPDQVDVSRFLAHAEAGRRALAAGDPAAAVAVLDEALAEWTGDPLAEFAGEPFAGPAIAHLENVHAEAVQDRAEARLLRGDVGWCVTELGQLVRDHLYRERLWELYAAALYRAGRPADALAALRRVRELLDEELGLAPGPGLRAVEQAILRHDEAGIPGVPAPPGPSAGQLDRL